MLCHTPGVIGGSPRWACSSITCSARLVDNFRNRPKSTTEELNILKEGQVKAARVLRFGPPNVIMNDDLPRPEPAAGQLLVRVKAAGVGHWDALVREGKLHHRLPLILGSELSGIVEAIGAEFSGFEAGDEVTGQPTSNLPGHTRNMHSPRPT